MYRVDFNYWTAGQGFSHTETVENIAEYCSAEEYAAAIDVASYNLTEDDGILIEIYDENDELKSSCWIYGE